MVKTVKEILIEAKAMCTPKTWGQGVTCPGGCVPDGKICAGMAIDKAAKVGSNEFQLVECRKAVSLLLAGSGFDRISLFNDSCTYTGIMAKFDEAIVLADRE